MHGSSPELPAWREAGAAAAAGGGNGAGSGRSDRLRRVLRRRVYPTPQSFAPAKVMALPITRNADWVALTSTHVDQKPVASFEEGQDGCALSSKTSIRKGDFTADGYVWFGNLQTRGQSP